MSYCSSDAFAKENSFLIEEAKHRMRTFSEQIREIKKYVILCLTFSCGLLPCIFSKSLLCPSSVPVCYENLLFPSASCWPGRRMEVMLPVSPACKCRSLAPVCCGLLHLLMPSHFFLQVPIALPSCMSVQLRDLCQK